MSVSGGSLGDRSKGCEYEKTGNRLRKQDERFTLVYRRFTQKKGTDFFPRTPRKKSSLPFLHPSRLVFYTTRVTSTPVPGWMASVRSSRLAVSTWTLPDVRAGTTRMAATVPPLGAIWASPAGPST